MPRPERRRWIHQSRGSFHVISRTADRQAWFTDAEKEHFVRLLERFARGFFVQVHAFCVMSNHFHLLVTELADEAADASEDELLRRYRKVYGKTAAPPRGRTVDYGDGKEVLEDPDDPHGIERLRARLGTLSRFVQELKQAFSRWYNRQHGRRGYLWGDRFKSVLVSKAGDAEVVTSAYIDLNPIRAQMGRRPEDYRWSSLGLRARDPKRAKRLLTRLKHPELRRHGLDWYRGLVYISGGVPAKGKNRHGIIPPELVDRCVERAGRLGIVDKFRYRCLNFTEGLAIGEPGFITKLQQELGRRVVRARQLWDTVWDGGADGGKGGGGTAQDPAALCATRVLRAPPPPAGATGPPPVAADAAPF